LLKTRRSKVFQAGKAPTEHPTPDFIEKLSYAIIVEEEK
jgi:hypothetical protein